MKSRFSNGFRFVSGCSLVLLCAASLLVSGVRGLQPSDAQLSTIYGAGYTGAACKATGSGCVVSGNCGNPVMVVVNGVNVMGCNGMYWNWWMQWGCGQSLPSYEQ